jgi:DNA-binding transcriptional LysR family regulator
MPFIVNAERLMLRRREDSMAVLKIKTIHRNGITLFSVLNNKGVDMERLVEMMTFTRVVEARSFSQAARLLKTSKSLVSKQVSDLEHSLGVKLLNRTTRSMSLTESGAAFYEHCARIAQAISEAEQTVSQLQSQPRGLLKITTPAIFAALHLAPVLRSFQQRYPEVEIELNATDRVVDLVEDGYDLAIRITNKPAQGTVARQIAPVRWITCAAPSYLKKHGTPGTPRDLLEHECLVYHGLPSLRTGWRYRIGNREVNLQVTGKCRVNNYELLLQLALKGMGIVLLPTYVLGPLVKGGKLQQMLHDSVAYPDMSLYATYMPNRYLQPKLRVFIDHLVGSFSPLPDWDDF